MPNLEQTPAALKDFYIYEFWRFVYVQQVVAQFAQTFIDFPPQQTPASFNIDAIVNQVKEQIAKNAEQLGSGISAGAPFRGERPSPFLARHHRGIVMATNAGSHRRPSAKRATAARHGLDPRRHVPHGVGSLLPEERPVREVRWTASGSTATR